MNDHFTDKQRKEIAEQEYVDYHIGKEVHFGDSQRILGYVSDKFSDSTGQQAYVVTDTKANVGASSVKHVTVLYRGSSTKFSSSAWRHDTFADWVKNDIPTALMIKGRPYLSPVLNAGIVLKSPTVTAQMPSSSNTLQKMMQKYPNADFSVYGHSLGSMNAQYAVANLSDKQQKRLSEAYFYEGPNMFGLLSFRQRQTVNALKAQNKLFNYVDLKDLVPLGYAKDGSDAVGNVFFVMSKSLGLNKVGQHMWGGYQFGDDGQLLVTSESMTNFANSVIRQDKKQLEQLRRHLTRSGGGLSESEEILLDAVEAKAMMHGMLLQLEHELDQLTLEYRHAMRDAEETWDLALDEARQIGQHLTAGEELEALAAGGVTKQTIRDEPIQEYQEKIKKIEAVKKEYRDFVKDVDEAIAHQLQTDHELAHEIKGLMG